MTGTTYTRVSGLARPRQRPDQAAACCSPIDEIQSYTVPLHRFYSRVCEARAHQVDRGLTHGAAVYDLQRTFTALRVAGLHSSVDTGSNARTR